MNSRLPIKNRGLSTLLWFFCCLFLLFFSLGLSWQVNKSANFFYEFWYSQLNIEQTIKTYVPQNTQGKRDFANTDNKQHFKSFNQIVDGIHNDGIGLVELSYLNGDNEQRTLLTKAEVVHLKDVSVLVNKLYFASAINVILLVIIVVAVYRFKPQKPLKKEQYSVVVIPTVSLLLMFSIFGFTEIFYYLHVLVFPDNHQWFFYYQESLMSSLMKAPDLFAGIGLSLLVITFAIYLIIYQLLMTKIFRG
jgi:uncharacterized membrane protein